MDACQVLLAQADHSSTHVSYDALAEPSCILNILKFLNSTWDLCSALAVNKLWKSVAEMPELWQQLYIRLHGTPACYERTPSPVQQFKRLAAIRKLASTSRTQLNFKARAACYCPISDRLVLLDNSLNLYFLKPGGTEPVVCRMQLGDLQQPVEKPLLAACGTGLIVAAGSDGTLQVWDTTSQQHVRSMARHAGSIMDLSADGDLVASSCSKELKLWSAASGECLLTRPHNSPIELADIVALGSPKVAVSSAHGLVLVMNHHFPPSNTIEVLSTRAESLGQRIICLDANATHDVCMHGSSLYVASRYETRPPTAASMAADRFYTVVATCWDMRSWHSYRLVSPRVRIAHGQGALRGLPLLHATGDLLLCGLLADDATSRMPFSCISAWQLPARNAEDQQDSSASSSILRMASHSPQQQGVTACSSQQQLESSSQHASSGDASCSSPSAAAGAGSSRAQPRSSSVMLVVGEDEKQQMISVLQDTQFKITKLLSTPRHMVYTTDLGHVFVHQLLPDAQGVATSG